jgi:two-component system sensor histidine kinase DesK
VRATDADPDCCESPEGSEVRGLWFSRRPRGIAQHTGAFVWLAFILFPAINAFAQHGTAVHHALTIAGAVAFVVTYIALILIWRQRYADRALSILFALLVAFATALTIGDGGGWAFLFTYCAACVGLISRRFGFAGVAFCCVMAGVTSAVSGAAGGQIIGYVASSAGIGFLLLVMRDLRIRNEELSDARAELARFAVAEERERFARDLHDLLGHSLSLIALKTELAGRLLRDRPDEAERELSDAENVARQALSEVREAVSGYRRPTLDGELAGARMALTAAGIQLVVHPVESALDPDAEGVLAWAVREGVTNVIRHSHARSCTVSVLADPASAAVEVADDGVGAAVANGHRGSGLAGLEERARDLGGAVAAGPKPDGGFRLVVTVPMSPR